MFYSAQKMVCGLHYPAIEKVNDLAALGWRRVTRKKGAGTKPKHYYFPCLRIPEDEARLIFDDVSSNKTAITYLGKFWKDATKMETVVRTTVFGLHQAQMPNMTDDQVTLLNLLDESDEEILSRFLDQQFSKKDAVKRRAEELVFMKTVEMVRQNQLAKEARHRLEQDDLAKMATIPSSEVHSNQIKANQDGESDDNDDESSIPFSPDSRKKRIVLRPGDVIEYYETNRVFGRPDARRVSTIVGINPRGHFPINLESGDPLQADDRIRRIQKMFKGHLVEETDGTFRAIKNYSLRAAGIMQNVAAQRMARQAQQLRTEHDSTIEQHWANPTEKCDDDPDQKASAPSDSKIQHTAMSATSSGKIDTAPLWHKRLSDQLELEEERMKKRRRYIPWITTDELKMVMKIWPLLQNRFPGATITSEYASNILANELQDISERRFLALLQGDPNNFLSQRDKEEIVQALGMWIDGQC
jgi:hypothetical protein